MLDIRFQLTKVRLQHMPGKNNPADLFTKILSRADFEKHRAFTLNTVARATVYAESEPLQEA